MHFLLNTRRARIAAPALVIAVILAGVALFAHQGGDSPSTPVPPTPTPPIPDDLAPDAVVDPPFASLTYGIHAFLWWNETTRTFDLENIRLMRFTHIKQRFSWHDIQPTSPHEWLWEHSDSVVDEVEYRERELVARLDGPPDWAVEYPSQDDPAAPPINLDAWATYCGTLAARYKGRIAAYQVWNEPNLQREWLGLPPSAEGYVRLLKPCAEAIRAADPDAVIISAGLAPTGDWLPTAIPDMDYLRLMYAAGAAEWFDVLGLNAPGYGAPPDLSPDEAEQQGRLRWMCFRHVEDMRAIMVAAGDAHKQIALLEVGWTTDTREGSDYAWHAVDQDTQAQYLVEAYQWAAEHWRPWVGLMVTIFMADIDWTEDDEEWWWAVNDGGYGAAWGGRPAYFALANMARWVGDEYLPARDPSAPESTTANPLPPREGE